LWKTVADAIGGGGQMSRREPENLTKQSALAMVTKAAWMASGSLKNRIQAKPLVKQYKGNNRENL